MRLSNFTLTINKLRPTSRGYDSPPALMITAPENKETLLHTHASAPRCSFVRKFIRLFLREFNVRVWRHLPVEKELGFFSSHECVLTSLRAARAAASSQSAFEAATRAVTPRLSGNPPLAEAEVEIPNGAVVRTLFRI
ncbi:hypothetical protein EVAR_60691_1 [Eumeta japonica]|uniref:Uncharacterized protein n=1 Tax=Eumeta variegata TaxID=151549 RepID=A0A4C1ZHX4_EUMVA|nr:hypothetical protein EVAR_60691_1 [Eumeta japonica]